jgi:hypothetical protein
MAGDGVKGSRCKWERGISRNLGIVLAGQLVTFFSTSAVLVELAVHPCQRNVAMSTERKNGVGYLESSFLGNSSQTKKEYATTDKSKSHHGRNRIGKKAHRAMSNPKRHPFDIAIHAALSTL